MSLDASSSGSAAHWPRVIAHADMDAFYASVEILDNPALARAAGNRRRTQRARRRHLGVVRGAQVRRAIRDADRAGAQTLSARDFRARPDGSLRRNFARRDARVREFQSNRRTALARRGVYRSDRHRAPARPADGRGARSQTPRARGNRTGRVGRRRLDQDGGEDFERHVEARRTALGGAGEICANS